MRVGPWSWVRPERRETMEVEKIRNLSDDELALEGRKSGGGSCSACVFR